MSEKRRRWFGGRQAKSADAPDLEGLWHDLARAIQAAAHDGGFDFDKATWEQTDRDIQLAWNKIAQPWNIEALRGMLGTGGNPDGERDIQEAYRQAVERGNTFPWLKRGVKDR